MASSDYKSDMLRGLDRGSTTASRLAQSRTFVPQLASGSATLSPQTATLGRVVAPWLAPAAGISYLLMPSPIGNSELSNDYYPDDQRKQDQAVLKARVVPGGITQPNDTTPPTTFNDFMDRLPQSAVDAMDSGVMPEHPIYNRKSSVMGVDPPAQTFPPISKGQTFPPLPLNQNGGQPPAVAPPGDRGLWSTMWGANKALYRVRNGKPKDAPVSVFDIIDANVGDAFTGSRQSFRERSADPAGTANPPVAATEEPFAIDPGPLISVDEAKETENINSSNYNGTTIFANPMTNEKDFNEYGHAIFSNTASGATKAGFNPSRGFLGEVGGAPRGMSEEEYAAAIKSGNLQAISDARSKMYQEDTAALNSRYNTAITALDGRPPVGANEDRPMFVIPDSGAAEREAWNNRVPSGFGRVGKAGDAPDVLSLLNYNRQLAKDAQERTQDAVSNQFREAEFGQTIRKNQADLAFKQNEDARAQQAHTMAQVKAADEGLARFKAQAGEAILANREGLAALGNDPGQFINQAYQLTPTDPYQALNVLAMTTQGLADSTDPAFTVAGQPVTEAEAVKLVNGERPFDSWIPFASPDDAFYKQAKQQAAGYIQRRALEALKKGRNNG